MDKFKSIFGWWITSSIDLPISQSTKSPTTSSTHSNEPPSSPIQAEPLVRQLATQLITTSHPSTSSSPSSSTSSSSSHDSVSIEELDDCPPLRNRITQRTNPITTSMCQSVDNSTPLSSSSLGQSSPKVKWFTVRATFPAIVLALSFSIPVGLLSAEFVRVGGVLVPAKLFASHPKLFTTIVILNAVAFSSSLIGIWLRNLHKSISEGLCLFSLFNLVVAFFMYLTILLPDSLTPIPYVLLALNFLVILYVGIIKYKKQSTSIAEDGESDFKDTSLL